jgi:hypothetical protein
VKLNTEEIQMSNKELFITTYIEKIAEKFSINKDKAFEIFSIATILDKTFDEIYADVIIPGPADGGIDGIYFDEQDGFYIMEIFQCKNSKKLSQNQLEKLKIDFAEVFEKGRRKEVKFTFNSQKSNISPKEPQAIISFSILNVKAVNFRMKALELCDLVDLEIETNGAEEKLFSENIRGFLGYNKTNRKIKDTLNDTSESIYFPFLNNGITILCDEMQIPSNPQAGQYIVPVVNPVIVNGLQTTKVIYDIYKMDITKLEGVNITVRLYETKDQDLIAKITEATNTQTSINFRDKISNKDFQKYVKLLFENKGIAYISKRGEIFTNKLSKEMHESITSEKAIKFWYATYYEKPENYNKVAGISENYDLIEKLIGRNV